MRTLRKEIITYMQITDSNKWMQPTNIIRSQLDHKTHVYNLNNQNLVLLVAIKPQPFCTAHGKLRLSRTQILYSEIPQTSSNQFSDIPVPPASHIFIIFQISKMSPSFIHSFNHPSIHLSRFFFFSFQSFGR